MALTYREVMPSDAAVPESAALALKSGWLKVWTCLDEARQIGHCAGDARSGEVVSLSVLPEYRRLGIGRTLLSNIVDWMRLSQVERIWLAAPADPNHVASGFYRALGWRATGERAGTTEYPIEVLVLPPRSESEP